jgi:hypothetical protein
MYAHPEAKTFLVTGDNLAGVTRRVLNQLWEAVSQGHRALRLNIPSECYLSHSQTFHRIGHGDPLTLE